jgi:hypothetical protein
MAKEKPMNYMEKGKKPQSCRIREALLRGSLIFTGGKCQIEMPSLTITRRNGKDLYFTDDHYPQQIYSSSRFIRLCPVESKMFFNLSLHWIHFYFILFPFSPLMLYPFSQHPDVERSIWHFDMNLINQFKLCEFSSCRNRYLGTTGCKKIKSTLNRFNDDKDIF